MVLLKAEIVDTIMPITKTSRKGKKNIQLRTGGLHLVIQNQISIAKVVNANPIQEETSLLLSSILTV